jgi:hypothetical protein
MRLGTMGFPMKKQLRYPLPCHERREAVALIPARTNKAPKELLTLVEEGVASWGGGKPSASSQPVKLRGQALSALTLEDRG